MRTVLKTQNNSILLYILAVFLLSSCLNRNIEGKKIIDTYELSNAINKVDTLQSLCIDLDFEAKTIIQYKIEDIDWGKIDFDNGCQVNLISPYFKEKIIFKVGLTAINIPLKFLLQEKSNTLIFQIIQQFNTVYEDRFCFIYDKKRSEWILDEASSITYTHKETDIICPYIFDAEQTRLIDVREMETGECIEVKRK